MSTGSWPLERLTNPRSVALLGASSVRSKWGYLFAQGVALGAEHRQVYFVNRKGGEVLGHPLHPSLRSLPEVPELVVLALPDGPSRAEIETCLDLGVEAIIAIGTPFDGPDDELLSRLRARGVVVLGPNCMGVAAPAHALDVAPGLFEGTDRPAGPVAVVTQSGTLGIDVSRQVLDQGLGLSAFFSVGNQYLLTAGDVIGALADDPATRAVVAYLEDPRDGERLVAGVRRAQSAGKTVVLLAAGASDAGRRAAASHSGALATEDRVMRALCDHLGCAYARSPAEAVSLARVAAGPGPGAGPRVGIISEGGGHGAVAADQVELRGLSVPPLTPDARARLQRDVAAPAELDNPVDLPGGRVDATVYSTAARALVESGAVDQILIAGSYGDLGALSPGREDYDAYRDGEWESAKQLASLQERSGCRVVVQSFYPEREIARWLAEQGVLVTRHLEDAARMLAADLAHGGHGDSAEGPAPAAAGAASPEAEVLPYWEARRLVGAAGVRLAEALRVTGPEEVHEAFTKIGAPAVLKALGRSHKSDRGGVVVGLMSAEEAAACATRMAGELGAEEFSLEADVAARDTVEVLVGARRSHRYGTVGLVGLGGVLTEALDDVQLAVPPITPETFARMIARLRSAKVFRGGRRGDLALEEIRHTLVALVDLVEGSEDVLEAEVNPLLCDQVGAVAVDARVVRRAR